MRRINNSIIHQLTEREKVLLSYEFSREYITNFLFEYQNKFNEIYRYFINIYRKIFMKRNTKNLKEEIKKLIEELYSAEQKVLNRYKILLFYIKMDYNNTDISLEFENEAEEKSFFNNLNKRKLLLEKYKIQYEELDKLKNNINSIYEKIIAKSCLDENK